MSQELMHTTNGSEPLVSSNTNTPPPQESGYSSPQTSGQQTPLGMEDRPQYLDSQRQQLEGLFTQGVQPQGYNNLYQGQVPGQTPPMAQGQGLSQSPQSTYNPYLSQGQSQVLPPQGYQSPPQVLNYTPNLNQLRRQIQNPTQPTNLVNQQSQVSQVNQNLNQNLSPNNFAVNGAAYTQSAAPAYQAPQQYIPQVQPQIQFQPQVDPNEYVNGMHIDELVNRNLPKVSNDGYANAETLVRQFGLPIESTAELLNESHVRLENWTMDLYNQAKSVAEQNAALQNITLDQQNAILQQDALLRNYAKQSINHSQFVKELLPHIDRYGRMEELLLDSKKLADYYKNLAAVESEYGTHQQQKQQLQQAQVAEENRQRQFVQALVDQGYDLSKISNEQLGQLYRQAIASTTQASQPAPTGQLPFAPGELLNQVDPSTLSPEDIKRVQNMTPQELAQLEYSMAIQMGLIQPQVQPQQQVQQPQQPQRQQQVQQPQQRTVGYSQYLNNQQQAQGPRKNFYQQVIEGAVPPSTYETNKMIADAKHEEARMVHNPLTSLDERSINSLRPNFPVANPRGESVAYPALDAIPASHRFLLLDKLEREGIIGQQRARTFA